MVETARLRLRAPRIEDFAAYAEIVATARGQYMFANPDRRTAWLDFTEMTAGWLLRGHGLWAVEPKAGGEVLGFVMLCFENGYHEEELGYLFREAAEGQGYASEAARAARSHAFGTLGWDTVVSTIDPDNRPSIRLAERLGARRDPAAERALAAQRAETCLVYRHKREEAA